jgi:hypothetical protein
LAEGERDEIPILIEFLFQLQEDVLVVMVRAIPFVDGRARTLDCSQPADASPSPDPNREAARSNSGPPFGPVRAAVGPPGGARRTAWKTAAGRCSRTAADSIARPSRQPDSPRGPSDLMACPGSSQDQAVRETGQFARPGASRATPFPNSRRPGVPDGRGLQLVRSSSRSGVPAGPELQTVGGLGAARSSGRFGWPSRPNGRAVGNAGEARKTGRFGRLGLSECRVVRKAGTSKDRAGSKVWAIGALRDSEDWPGSEKPARRTEWVRRLSGSENGRGGRIVESEETHPLR